jgi:RecB family endonuclease NucS
VLGLDSEGVLHILELKRDRTPRDVVAQALDYASWVQELGNES